MDTQVSISQEGQQLTKRQKRELKRQEYEQERMKSSRRRRGAAFVWWGLGILVLVAIIWAIVAASDPVAVAFDDSDDPFQGSETASVVVREFSDFQCPACRSAEPLVAAINEEFGDKIKFVYKDYPLTGIHDRAYVAAIAAQCAMPENRFWAFHDRLFQNQSSWSTMSEPDAKAVFAGYAGELGMNVDNFNSCLDSSETRAKVDQDMAEGNRNGVNATPTFFINDTRVQNVGLSLDSMKQMITAALEEAESGAANANVTEDTNESAEDTNTSAETENIEAAE